jgi:hypothetical protein
LAIKANRFRRKIFASTTGTPNRWLEHSSGHALSQISHDIASFLMTRRKPVSFHPVFNLPSRVSCLFISIIRAKTAFSGLSGFLAYNDRAMPPTGG